MGAIYRARDLHFGRDVALKILSEGRNQDARVSRFRCEAKVLGQLQHPGIPPAFDHGSLPDGRAFIAMKLIEGQTLADLLAARESPHRDLMHYLGVFKQVCETVAFAHARGVIHRDLKPENVMVGAFGEVQVMDWGLAKQLNQQPADAETGGHPGDPIHESAAGSPDRAEAQRGGNGRLVTLEGAVIGTPAYMPPEQACASPGKMSEKSDIFSLGAILCEILTGFPPYTGSSSNARLEQAREASLDEARRRLAASGADAGLIELAEQCLSPNPADRVPSALAIATQIEADFESIQERLRDAELEQTRQAELRHRRRLQTTLVVVVSLSVTMLTAGWTLVANQNAAHQRHVVEEVSTALGEASQLRSQALREPLNGTSSWAAATAAIDRATVVAEGVTDRDLLSRLEDLSSLIHRESGEAERDRELVSRLTAAHAPASHPEFPAPRLNERHDPSGHRMDGDGRFSRPRRRPPHHFGGPPAHRPPPRTHHRGPDRRGHDTGRIVENQRVRAESASEKVIDALAAFELDPRRVSALQAAKRINRRPNEVRQAVVDAMDSWLSALGDAPRLKRQHQNWALAFLEQIDPNPERTRIRSLVGEDDQEALRGVAAGDLLPTQSPSFVWLVASRMDIPHERIQLLREARARNPESLLINQQLGQQLVHDGHGVEAIDAFMAALAIRPEAGTSAHVAILLADHGRHDESIAMFRNAIQLDPDYPDVYVRLAEILTWLERGREALEVADKALARFPRNHADRWRFHAARGEALEQLDRPDEAVDAFRLALGLDSLPDSDRDGLLEHVQSLDTELSD